MTVDLDASTTYHAATDASASDVAVGDDVAVAGRARARPPGGGGDADDTRPADRQRRHGRALSGIHQ